MTINGKEHIERLRNAVIQNAEASYAALQACMVNMTSMQFFAAVKFERLGQDPIDGQAQNLIEQINQMYSDLVVLAAAEDLLTRYPGITLEVQLGVSSGFDIQSTDGSIVAECFSVTTVTSNRKLDKDCKKLMQSNAPIKCVYFYSHNDSDEKLRKKFCKYPVIYFKRIVFDNLQTSTRS